jgi:hypothetical protein
MLAGLLILWIVSSLPLGLFVGAWMRVGSGRR